MSTSAEEHLTALSTDLRIVTEELRWAHAAGYGKAGRGLDAPRGAALRALDAEDLYQRALNPDYEKGPVDDIGLGDYRCRKAYQSTAVRIGNAESRLTLAVAIIGPTELQPALIRPTKHDDLDTVNQCLRGLSWRVAWLRSHDARPATRQVAKARGSIDRCVRGLWQALGRGETDGMAHGEELCHVCGIRPRAEKVKDDGKVVAAKGGRCDTCSQWHTRNGFERPTKLDDKITKGPRAAQRRRLERGEGWGAA